ncbi:MAG TPA: hypothetical protein VIF57_26100 [Polyangia bacterium]|jgi:hypothetical protein
MPSLVDVMTDSIETGGASMFSFNRICVAGAVIFGVAAVLMASGCNTTGASGLHRAAEVRVATTLGAGSSQLIVSGPARLLHVDVRSRKTLNIYRVKLDATGAADCASAVRSEVRALRESASTELDLAVRDDEAICLANVAGDSGRADVSWHARRGAEAPAEVMQARND